MTTDRPITVEDDTDHRRGRCPWKKEQWPDLKANFRIRHHFVTANCSVCRRLPVKGWSRSSVSRAPSTGFGGAQPEDADPEESTIAAVVTSNHATVKN